MCIPAFRTRELEKCTVPGTAGINAHPSYLLRYAITLLLPQMTRCPCRCGKNEEEPNNDYAHQEARLNSPLYFLTRANVTISSPGRSSHTPRTSVSSTALLTMASLQLAGISLESTLSSGKGYVALSSIVEMVTQCSSLFCERLYIHLPAGVAARGARCVASDTLYSILRMARCIPAICRSCG